MQSGLAGLYSSSRALYRWATGVGWLGSEVRAAHNKGGSMESKKRIALVTGGMGGLGEAICIKLANLGDRVVTTYSPQNSKSDKRPARCTRKVSSFTPFPAMWPRGTPVSAASTALPARLVPLMCW